MYTLCNMVSHGETVSTELVAHGAVAKVVPLLKVFDFELLHVALAFIEATLRYSENVGVKSLVKFMLLFFLCGFWGKWRGRSVLN